MIVPLISFADVITFNVNNCAVSSGNNFLQECIPQRKVIEIEQTPSDTLEIGVQDEAGDLYTYIMGNNNLIDYRVNSSSSKPRGSSLMIFDKTDNLVINTSGFNGTNGISAGEICRDKMKSSWGAKYLNYYNTKYGMGANTPCDNEDQKKIYDEEFICDPGFTQSNNGKVSLSFMDYQRQCKGNIVKNVCLKKTYDIDCRAYVKGAGCCGLSEVNSIDQMIETNIPFAKFSFTGASCDYLSCGNGKNGLFYGNIFNNRSLIDVQNPNFCTDNVTGLGSAPTATISIGSNQKTYTIGSELNYSNFFNNLIVKDNANSNVANSSYSVFLTNGPSIKTRVSNCYGLNGSDPTKKDCTINIAPTTMTFRAVTDKQLVTDTISLTIECSTGNVKVGASCVPQHQTRSCSVTGGIGCTTLSASQSTSDGGVTWSSCSANSCGGQAGCAPRRYSWEDFNRCMETSF